jgi:hypothetical protein
MERITKKMFEDYLNEMKLTEEEMIIGGKNRKGKYGTMLRNHDKIAFEIAYKEFINNYPNN